MLKEFKYKIKKIWEIYALIFIILTTIFLTLTHHSKQNVVNKNFSNLINNIYLKKTLNYTFNNLEPKYKKINHKIKSGETFDKILKYYSINKEEILIIKKNLLKKINLNKLNTRQSFQITLDQTNNKIREFIFKISSTEKIYLKRNNKDDKFRQEILTIKLDKQIIFIENIILQSLYKAATEKNIPANI